MFNRKARTVWGNSYLPMDSDWKPGGTRIVSFGSVSGRIKKSGVDLMGRWTYQLFQRGDNVHSVIFSIYHCCKTPTNKKVKKTAHYQQELMLSDLNRSGTPRQFFKKDLISEIHQLKTNTVHRFRFGYLGIRMKIVIICPSLTTSVRNSVSSIFSTKYIPCTGKPVPS